MIHLLSITLWLWVLTGGSQVRSTAIEGYGTTYIPSAYAPRGYITGWFYKSDYSCTSFPPQVVFSFATGVCYANTTTGQNFVLTSNGSIKKNQLVVQITTYWDSKCYNPQSTGTAAGYNTLCTVQTFGGFNYYGHYTFSPNVPAVVSAPGYEIRYYNSAENCGLRSATETKDFQSKTDPSSTRPYLVSWQSTEYSKIIKPLSCSIKSYPKYGSTFFTQSQETALPGAGSYKVGSRNFLSCFHENETVITASGERVQVQDLQVGDKVWAANSAREMEIASVIAVPHKSHAVGGFPSSYTRLTAAGGLSILVTPDHLMVTGQCNSSSTSTLLSAKNINANDCVATILGWRPVLSVEHILDAGAHYSVVTSSEYVVVSGFVASPFAWSHNIGQSFYAIARVLHSLCPMVVMQRPLIWILDSLGLFAHLIDQSIG